MKKLITACMALVALAAFALPATAAAATDPDLTAPTGTLMATGQNIQGTNIGVTRMTNSEGGTLVECAVAKTTGTLTKNNGTEAEGNITSASFTSSTGSDCSGILGATAVTPNPATNGLPWCLQSLPAFNSDEFRIRGNSCASASRPIRFVLDVTNLGVTCTYQRSSFIPGTYATHPEEAILTISKVEFPLLEGGFGCPSVGFLDMSFTLETDPASGSASPIYIS